MTAYETLSGHPMAPDALWRLCIDPQSIAMLGERGIDTSNPLLRFLFDAQPGYLHHMACGWEWMAQRAQETAPLDAQDIIDLNGVCTGSEKEDGQIHYSLEVDDAEFGLLEGATLTYDGERALAATAAILRRHGITLRIGREDDAQFSAISGRRFLTLSRDAVEAPAMRAVLALWLAMHAEERKVAGADREAQTLADLRLAGRIDQSHIFGNGNIRTCHLLINYFELRRGNAPFMFHDPNIFDGFGDKELGKALARLRSAVPVGDVAAMEVDDWLGDEEYGNEEADAWQGAATVRLPHRNGRVGDDFPWPLENRMKLRLRYPNHAQTIGEISRKAASTSHGGKLLARFARRVIRAGQEQPAPGLRAGSRRYAAAFDAADGGKPVEVALLAFVRNGRITDIRLDTLANRAEIGRATGLFRVPEAIAEGRLYAISESLYVMLANHQAYVWTQPLHAAMLSAGYQGTILMFVREVVRPGAGRSEDGLPDGAFLFDYSPPGQPTITLVAKVVDEEIKGVQLDDPDGIGRFKIRNPSIVSSNAASMRRARGETYKVDDILAKRLRTPNAELYKALLPMAEKVQKHDPALFQEPNGQPKKVKIVTTLARDIVITPRTNKEILAPSNGATVPDGGSVARYTFRYGEAPDQTVSLLGYVKDDNLLQKAALDTDEGLVQIWSYVHAAQQTAASRNVRTSSRHRDSSKTTL